MVARMVQFTVIANVEKKFFLMMIGVGSILKYNTLWRLGMHYKYDFFMVTHVSKTGIPMGTYLNSKCEVIEMDDTTMKKQWTIGESFGKKRRLPHPSMWDHVSPEEQKNGFTTLCCIN